MLGIYRSLIKQTTQGKSAMLQQIKSIINSIRAGVKAFLGCLASIPRIMLLSTIDADVNANKTVLLLKNESKTEKKCIMSILISLCLLLYNSVQYYNFSNREKICKKVIYCHVFIHFYAHQFLCSLYVHMRGEQESHLLTKSSLV